MPLQDLTEGLRTLGFVAGQWLKSIRGGDPLPPRRHPEALPVHKPRGTMPPRRPHVPIADLCPKPMVQIGDRWVACAAPRVAGRCPLHGAFPPTDGDGNQA